MKNLIVSITKNISKGSQGISLHFKRAFSTDESKFMLLTGLQVMIAPLIAAFFVGLIFWFFLNLDYTFFETQGLPRVGELRGAFIDYLLDQVLFYVPFISLFFVSLFFIGTYLATLLIRPFEVIGEYCDKKLEGGLQVDYRPDMFSELKLLMRFSEFFFSYTEGVEKNKKLSGTTVPPYYTRIRGPIFETAFFINFCLFMGIVGIGISYFIFGIASDMQEGLIILSIKSLSMTGQGAVVRQFLAQQGEMLEIALWASMILLGGSYFLLSLYLYAGVSHAAFAVFSTMRAFMRGNYDSRVHLIGHGHLRKHTRSINKYLDYLQRNYSDDFSSKNSYAKEKEHKSAGNF